MMKHHGVKMAEEQGIELSGTLSGKKCGLSKINRLIPLA